MCGIVGVHAPGQEAAAIAALGLFALQHRGQESAGVAVSDGEGVMVYKDLGLIAQVLEERRLASLRGDLAIAHCRYSTTGSTVWENSQPTFRLGPRRTVAMGHNGNLVNTRALLTMLPGGRARLVGTSDTDLLTALLAEEPAGDLVEALQRVLPRVSGAYSLVVMDEHRVIGVRDPYGFRPLVLGRLPAEPVVGEASAPSQPGLETASFPLPWDSLGPSSVPLPRTHGWVLASETAASSAAASGPMSWSACTTGTVLFPSIRSSRFPLETKTLPDGARTTAYGWSSAGTSTVTRPVRGSTHSTRPGLFSTNRSVPSGSRSIDVGSEKVSG